MKGETMGAMFKKGYKESREEKKRQEKRKEEYGKKLFDFFLRDDGDEAEVHFLTEEPVNFEEHTFKSTRGGKDNYNSVLCTGKDCEHCAEGDRPNFRGAYLVVDHREYKFTDKDGKKQTGRDQVRTYKAGLKVVSKLDRVSTKYGLTDREITIVRLGKGTATDYAIEKGEEDELSEKQIRNYLPENLRDDYDGSMESLYKILEDQLMMGAPDSSKKRDDNDDEDDEDSNTEGDVMGVDDEDERPRNKSKKTSSISKKKKGGLFKKPQDQIRPDSAKRAKSLLKKV